jgi:leader peptidase (prepilin peptidase) / N-methyltransferase
MDAPEIGEVLLGVAFCAMLAAVTITDLRRRIIPNTYLIAGTVAGLAIILATDAGSLGERAIAAIGAGGVLLALALINPQGMGMGDVKLAAVMGLYLGRAVIPALLVGFAAGGVVGMALLARHGATARKRPIPFGPFLALGGVFGLLLGDAAVDWYGDQFL